MNIAIILAGGVGARVGAQRPKQFIEVLGKPIIAYTIDIFQEHEEVDAIEIVCHKDWKKFMGEIIAENRFEKVKWIVDGGRDFQESVVHGIDNLDGIIKNEDLVLLHYAAAPFTSEKIVSDALKVCRVHRMAASCTPCYQLMGSNDRNRESKKWVNRDNFIQIACPQCYQFGYIKEIYRRAEVENLIDNTEPHTTSLMYKLGETIFQSYGDQTNIKITTAEDIELFKGYVLARQKGEIST